MKTILAVYILFTSLLITGCTEKENPPSGVEIQVTNIAAAQGGTEIKYRIINHTDSLLGYGAYYKIDRLNGEEWVPQPVNDETAFIDIFYSLSARDSSDTYSVALYPERFTYPPGEYRLRKDIHVGEMKQTLTAVFTLEGERNVQPQVKFEISPVVYDRVPEKITYTITNNTKEKIEFGTYYEMNRLEGLEWVDVPLPNSVFNDIAIMPSPGMTYSDDIYLYPAKASYPGGIYRIQKQVRIGDENRMVYAHFRIK